MNIVSKISITLFALYVLVGGFFLFSGIDKSILGFIFGLLVWLWMSWPIFLLTSSISKFKTRLSKIIGLILQTILAGLSVYIYYDSMYVHPDAQGALVFFFIPLWSLVLIVISKLLIQWIESLYLAKKNS